MNSPHHTPRVLFVCIGNACRSQMAEAYAKKFSGGAIIAGSAGLAPALTIPPVTREVMGEKRIDLGDAFPKPLGFIAPAKFDLVVNISGREIPEVDPKKLRVWDVKDPITGDKDLHRKVRDEIESLVMELVLELRRQYPMAAAPRPAVLQAAPAPAEERRPRLDGRMRPPAPAQDAKRPDGRTRPKLLRG